MNRRTFSLFLLLSPLLAHAKTGATAQVAILTDLINAIGAAGEAISKLTAGFKDLVVAGRDSYKYVSAERERDRLIDISRRTANLVAVQNIRVVQSIDEYLAERNPINAEADWARVAQSIGATLVLVQQLLNDVQSEDGSFVLEPAFLTLNETLSSRTSLLTKLASLPAPNTKEEVALLRQASSKYKILIANAKQAIDELNVYVKSKK